MAYMVGKFISGAVIKGHHVLLTDDKTITSGDRDEIHEKEISELK